MKLRKFLTSVIATVMVMDILMVALSLVPATTPLSTATLSGPDESGGVSMEAGFWGWLRKMILKACCKVSNWDECCDRVTSSYAV